MFPFPTGLGGWSVPDAAGEVGAGVILLGPGEHRDGGVGVRLNYRLPTILQVNGE
jgi:hypothetical protein